MFGCAGSQEVKCLLVAGAAVFVRYFFAIGDRFRFMGLVAFLAVSLGHFGGVRLVALGALRNLAVYVVAGRAEEFRVFARELFQLSDLLGMAGQARIGDVAGKHDVERSMGILVAPEAARQFVVLFAGVALATLGDVVLGCGAVACVTILASDFLVPGACSSDVSRRSRVTFHAVVG